MQVYKQIGISVMLQRTLYHLLSIFSVPYAEQGVSESACESSLLARVCWDTSHCPCQEFRRDGWCLSDQQVRCANQPIQHPLVYGSIGRRFQCLRASYCSQQLPGNPVRWRARRRESTPRIAVPCGTYRNRHLVVQGFADQRMAEPEAVAVFGQYAGGAGFVHRLDQVWNLSAQDDREVCDGEVHAEKSRCADYITDGSGNEAEAVSYSRGEGARGGITRCYFGGACLGDGQAVAALQSRNQFGEVERITRGTDSEPQEIAVGLASC